MPFELGKLASNLLTNFLRDKLVQIVLLHFYFNVFYLLDEIPCIAQVKLLYGS